MASLIIRKLDEDVKARLRVRAARHGRSMEEEAREILRTGVSAETPPMENLADSIRRHISPLGGIELRLQTRERVRRRANLGR